uniref:NADH dehydrogenase subunit 2 n=1 Tax=Lissoclinum patella TaxID=13110 RepID=A0A059VIP1_9ASCI|nr:NADH dehydrogenase subunit 2 [Lissoclinum patella]
MWVMLEMGNLFLLLYLFISYEDGNYSKKAGIIMYFFIQMVGSMGLLIGVFFNYSFFFMFFFLMKLGSFPFFMWVVTIFSLFIPQDLFIISAMTKILPLFMFIMIIPKSSFFFFFFFLKKNSFMKFLSLLSLLGFPPSLVFYMKFKMILLSQLPTLFIFLIFLPNLLFFFF